MIKYLTEEEIKTELDDYLYRVKMKYAVLLNGSWGSGKTYFITNYIKGLEYQYEQHKDNNNKKYKKPIYISLYGLSSILEIKNKILISLVKSKTAKKLMPFLDIGIEIGNDLISKKTFIQNPDRKLSKALELFYKLDNLIICFDDLERCDININSILGYINELVEHNNIKVILVADESKIGIVNYDKNIELKYIVSLSDKIKFAKENNQNPLVAAKDKDSIELTKEELNKRIKILFNESNIYKEIKEKLIGKTIFYRANIEEIYDILKKDLIHNAYAEKTVEKNKEKFLNLLDENHCYNLRIIQFIFQTFNRLAEETINIIDFEEVNNIYLNDLFLYCSIKSLKLLQGENTYNWHNDQTFGTVYLGNEEDYISKNYVVGFRFVDDYLMISHLDKEYIKNTLLKYKRLIINENNNPNDPLYKLKTWWLISEKDLNELLDELIDKINNNNYDLELYSKIVTYLSFIEEMDISVGKIKDAIKKLESNIEENIVNGNYNEDSLFWESGEILKRYENNIKKIRELVENKKYEEDNNRLGDIFNSDAWGSEFKYYCEINNSRFMEQKHFADILDIDKIIFNIENKEIKQIYNFWYGLQKIYNFSNINEYYKNDKQKLLNLKNRFLKIENVDKAKKFALKRIVNYLDRVIEML